MSEMDVKSKEMFQAPPLKKKKKYALKSYVKLYNSQVSLYRSGVGKLCWQIWSEASLFIATR